MDWLARNIGRMNLIDNDFGVLEPFYITAETFPFMPLPLLVREFARLFDQVNISLAQFLQL